MEGQLAWCVAVCGAVVGGQSWSGGLPAGHPSLDGELSKRCFAVVACCDGRAEATGGGSLCAEALELALLKFMAQLRQVT